MLSRTSIFVPSARVVQEMTRRSIRQGQLISPFGVGAIIDIGQESFVMTDISRWKADEMRAIESSFLERKLNTPIRCPSGKEVARPIAINRFPRWHFCPRCRLMRMVTGMDDLNSEHQIPRCTAPKCKSDLTPMGFVAACRNGHLSDVDWHRWAHSTHQGGSVCSRQTASMKFETTGEGGGDWTAISVRCACGASRDFAGLVQVEGPAGLICHGGQPWQYQPPPCGEKVTVYRRAASNLHFSKQISALDLQPEDVSGITGNAIEQAWEASDFISMARALAAADVSHDVILSAASNHADRISREYGCRPSLALECLRGIIESGGTSEGDEGTRAADVQQAILQEEWSVLSGRADIKTEHLDVRRKAIPLDWPVELRRTIRSMSMVRRMREVRALLGFRRLNPDEGTPLVPVDLGAVQAGWLPGVEAWGEGIFIQLNEEAVLNWEERARPPIEGQLRSMRQSVEGMGWDSEWASLRFIMLHSLAHALIRRLGFDAGYSASSIRERIYASSGAGGMCGILLYTADGDSEGSLGGLVRMGDPTRFSHLAEAALADIVWCSADPVCRETSNQQAAPLNAAACHACILASETTCCCNNSLLDRRTLIGVSEMEPFFRMENMKFS